MSATIVEFLYTPYGLVLIMGLGLLAGVFYAYKKSDSEIDKSDKEKDMFSEYYSAIKRHGNNSKRMLVRGGTVIGMIWKELKKDENRVSSEIKKFIPSIKNKDDKEDDVYNEGIIKLAVCKNKGIHKLLTSIPILRKMVLDIYLISEKNIQRSINAIVLNNRVSFDRVVGIWADMTPETVSDVYNVHGLDLLRQNMEQNKDFAKKMEVLDPETAKQMIMIEEGYNQKSKYYNNKKQQRHG